MGDLLRFIAMVINCASEIEKKMVRIRMVVDAAREILGITNVEGDETNRILEKGFEGSRITQKEISGITNDDPHSIPFVGGNAPKCFFTLT